MSSAAGAPLMYAQTNALSGIANASLAAILIAKHPSTNVSRGFVVKEGKQLGTMWRPLKNTCFSIVFTCFREKLTFSMKTSPQSYPGAKMSKHVANMARETLPKQHEHESKPI